MIYEASYNPKQRNLKIELSRCGRHTVQFCYNLEYWLASHPHIFAFVQIIQRVPVLLSEGGQEEEESRETQSADQLISLSFSPLFLYNLEPAAG